MIDMNVVRTGAMRILLALGLIISATAYLFGHSPQNIPHGKLPDATDSTRPSIVWTPSDLNTILTPGQTTTADVSFTSSLPLQNITIEAVPEIAGFFTITPSTIVAASAGQPQSIHIALSAGKTLGVFTGTIHIRNGKDTLPQTLKVTINVWQSVQFSAAHVSFDVPPQWAVQATPSEVDISTVELQTLITEQDAEVPPEDFTVRILPRTPGVSLGDFASTFDNGWFQNYANKTTVVIDGHAGIIFDDASATISHEPTLAAFIDQPDLNQIVFITMTRVTPGENINTMFSQILSTTTF